MADCKSCKRTDIKCCHTCARNPYTCNAWHKCEEDCEGYKPQIKTNADHIRSMSDEELAEWLDSISVCNFIYGRCIHLFGDGIDCKQCMMEWLKAEVKE